mmetsp:Transcript_5345/g.22641  ORF Transcript_5345/g.22641 Transcript_5345/m.22641 type:complete len:488 (+) Transcript_5345:873-2336(+)
MNRKYDRCSSFTPEFLYGWYDPSPLGLSSNNAASGLNISRAISTYHSRVNPPASMPSSPANSIITRPLTSLGLKYCKRANESVKTCFRLMVTRVAPCARARGSSAKRFRRARMCATLLSKSIKRGFSSSTRNDPSVSSRRLGCERTSALTTALCLLAKFHTSATAESDRRAMSVGRWGAVCGDAADKRRAAPAPPLAPAPFGAPANPNAGLVTRAKPNANRSSSTETAGLSGTTATELVAWVPPPLPEPEPVPTRARFGSRLGEETPPDADAFASPPSVSSRSASLSARASADASAKRASTAGRILLISTPPTSVLCAPRCLARAEASAPPAVAMPGEASMAPAASPSADHTGSSVAANALSASRSARGSSAAGAETLVGVFDDGFVIDDGSGSGSDFSDDGFVDGRSFANASTNASARAFASASESFGSAASASTRAASNASARATSANSSSSASSRTSAAAAARVRRSTAAGADARAEARTESCG